MKQEFFSGMRLWTDIWMKSLKQVILVKSSLEFWKTSSLYELFGYLSPYVFWRMELIDDIVFQFISKKPTVYLNLAGRSVADSFEKKLVW